MSNYNSFIKVIKCFSRQYGTKVKVKIDDAVSNDIENKMYKPKKHPGINKSGNITLPDCIIGAIKTTIDDYPTKTLAGNANAFARHLKGRVAPMEPEEYNQFKDRILQNVLRKEGNVEITKEEEEEKFKQKIQNKVARILREKVYNWTPIKYDAYTSLLYLFARSAQEYAVMVKIFSEISARDSEFKPRSVFDFGSGVGTVSWAADLLWKKYIFEHFNVDASADMNELAETILHGGRGRQGENLKGVFYRQFLPANQTTYDLVVSGYSLLELPNFQSRMDTILKLWNKTEKYLVLVENGTNAGFKVINEARDFILQIQDKHNKAHVFSPCPHDFICPRFVTDNTPCNFEVTYSSLPIGAVTEYKKELYSYVVLQKGERNNQDRPWPRVVREILVRPQHTICRICTSQGKLDEVIFTASKHGKTTYHCARATKWGDRLPVTLKEENDSSK